MSLVLRSFLMLLAAIHAGPERPVSVARTRQQTYSAGLDSVLAFATNVRLPLETPISGAPRVFIRAAGPIRARSVRH